MEIFDDTEMIDPRGTAMPLKRFAKLEGVEFAPTLLFYENDGMRVLRLTGYQSPERFTHIIGYVANDHYSSGSLRDFLKQQAADVLTVQSGKGLIEDPLFGKPPYALDRSHFPASKPLLVIFESKGCTECQEFHSDVLALQEVRETLQRFEIVGLDTGDTKTPILAPDGARITPSAWFEQAGFSRVPALLFFDEHGNEVLKTDALVMQARMMNSLNFVLEQAYEKDWTYQQFARSQAIERSQQKLQ